MNQINKVIFVCTGNTCRSPMAEGLLKRMVNNDKLIIESRGLMVLTSEPASNLAVEAMNEKGIDISSHRSKSFDVDEIDANTLILTMTQRHKSVIHQYDIHSNLFNIKEFVGHHGDINDPYGGTIADYRTCLSELEILMQKIGGLIG